MHAANRHEREMNEALAADEPLIVWALDKRSRIMVAVHIDDPHTLEPRGRIA